MKSTRLIGVAALTISSGITLWGCPKEQPSTQSPGMPTTGGNVAPGARPKVAVIPKGTENSFWLGVKAGADAAGKEDNVEIVWQGPASENDITQQIDVVKNQITNKVDGIVLAACDAQALARPVKEAVDKGIPVVTVDSGLNKDKDVSLAYIATDNVKGGAVAADELAKAIGSKGDVGILIFLKGAASSDQREKGFMDEIKKYPDIHVVTNLETHSKTNEAVDRTNDMLTANPKLVGIFASNQPNGEGASKVIATRNLIGKVKIVAFDGSDVEQKAVKSGAIQALIVQDPYQMGYKGVKTVELAIKKQPIPEKNVDSGLSVVTKENMDSPEMQKKLNPGK